MKNIIFLTIVFLGFIILSGCGGNQMEQNPEAVTTVEMKERPKDTMLVSMEMDSLWGFHEVGKIQLYNKETGLVVYEKEQYSKAVYYLAIVGIVAIFILILWIISKATE